MKLGNLDVDEAGLGAICRKWHVVKVEVFGSALRDDFGPSSDVDLLVTFAPDHRPDMVGLMQLQAELEALLGRKVDLAEREQLKWVIRDQVLREAQIVYSD